MDPLNHSISRTYLVWRLPGSRVEIGRVELIGPATIRDPEPHSKRTAAEVKIPAGSIFEYRVEETPVGHR